MTSNATVTVIPHTRTSYLTPDTVIDFDGKLYRITKSNKVNYNIVDQDGNSFSVNRHAVMVVAENQEEALKTFKTPEIFNPGEKVLFVGRGMLNGKHALVFESTVSKSKIVVEGVGSFTAPTISLAKI